MSVLPTDPLNLSSQEVPQEQQSVITNSSLTTAIEKKLNSKIKFGNFFNGIHNRIANHFNKQRKVALTNLKNILNNLTQNNFDNLIQNNSDLETKNLPKSIRKQYENYINFKAKELENEINKNKGEKLGKGSFGTVYKMAGKDGKTYAIKISKNVDKNAKEAFNKEKQANEALFAGLNSLPEPQRTEKLNYFAGYHGSFEIGGKSVIITEFVECGKKDDGSSKSLDFDTYIKNFHESPTPEGTKEMMGLMQQAFEKTAIEESLGLVNRDIKPENMMVAMDANGNLQIKGMDYGTACNYMGVNDLYEIGLGTPKHMAPQVLKNEDVLYGASSANDVYSMGISLLNGLFGDVYEKEIFKFPWYIADYVQDGKLSDALKGKTFDVLEEDGVINKGSLETLKTNLGNDDKKITFLANLVADCTAYEPKDRISAKQAAYLLGEFNKGNYDYEELKKASGYPPKAIPDAILNTISSKDEETQKQGIEALKKLVLADPSYIETDTFKELDASAANEVKKSEEYKSASERLSNRDVKDNVSITENASQAPKVENSSGL